jgi:prepilin-type N-terminal cleavage/methylation domain-containing protein
MRAVTDVHDDRGETLLELIVAIMILGVCVVAIGTGVTLSVKISGIHRDQSTASAYLHNYAEALQRTYTPCASTYSQTVKTYLDGLRASGPGTPAHFGDPAASIKFWQASTDVPTDGLGKFVDPPTSPADSCPATDGGVQKLTLQLKSTDGFVTESLDVVLRSTT